MFLTIFRRRSDCTLWRVIKTFTSKRRYRSRFRGVLLRSTTRVNGLRSVIKVSPTQLRWDYVCLDSQHNNPVYSGDIHSGSTSDTGSDLSWKMVLRGSSVIFDEEFQFCIPMQKCPPQEVCPVGYLRCLDTTIHMGELLPELPGNFQDVFRDVENVNLHDFLVDEALMIVPSDVDYGGYWLEESAGCCRHRAVLLFTILKALGFQVEFAASKSHIWVIVEGMHFDVLKSPELAPKHSFCDGPCDESDCSSDESDGSSYESDCSSYESDGSCDKTDGSCDETDGSCEETVSSCEETECSCDETASSCEEAVEEPVVALQPKPVTKKQLAVVAAMIRKDLNRDRQIRRKIRERAAKAEEKKRERMRIVREMMMR